MRALPKPALGHGSSAPRVACKAPSREWVGGLPALPFRDTPDAACKTGAPRSGHWANTAVV